MLQTRVKSLSKGNNSKKDVLTSNVNLKESSTVPLSSVTGSAYEDRTTDGWPDENEGDDFSPPEEHYEQVKPSLKKNGKLDSYATTDDKLKKPSGQIKWKDIPKVEPQITHAEDDLSALLQVSCLLLSWLYKKSRAHLYLEHVNISGRRGPCKCPPDPSRGDHEYC